MKESREYFYELVDNIPEEKLEELRKSLLIMAMPEADVSDEEMLAIRKGQDEIANGQFVTFRPYEDMDMLFTDD